MLLLCPQKGRDKSRFLSCPLNREFTKLNAIFLLSLHLANWSCLATSRYLQNAHKLWYAKTDRRGAQWKRVLISPNYARWLQGDTQEKQEIWKQTFPSQCCDMFLTHERDYCIDFYYVQFLFFFSNPWFMYTWSLNASTRYWLLKWMVNTFNLYVFISHIDLVYRLLIITIQKKENYDWIIWCCVKAWLAISTKIEPLLHSKLWKELSY